MKKFLSLALAVILGISVTACSVTVEKPQGETASGETVTQESKESSDSKETAEAGKPKTDYPTKPITMMIPYGAGGTTDTYGRKLAVLLEKYLGQSVTVTNQSGASGSVGSQFVKDQPSDGYTLLISSEAMGTYRTMGTCELGYDDFTVIAPLVGDPKVLVVPKNSPYNTLEELMEAIKENPGKLTMSHSGPGGSGHNQGLVFKELGYEVNMVPFDSGNNALLGVVSGEVDFSNPNISTLQSYIESGDVKALAVFSTERMEAYPDIPAFSESFPDAASYLDIPYTALSFLVNNDTPEEIVEVLKDAAGKVFEDPEWVEFVETNAAEKLYDKYTDEASINAFYEKYESLIGWLQYDNGVAQKSPEDYGIKRFE